MGGMADPPRLLSGPPTHMGVMSLWMHCPTFFE
jgi:hypothetical protein